jgi:glutathione S-transferase
MDFMWHIVIQFLPALKGKTLMLKLHGSPISNYYNMAKTAMLEKGIEFEEVGAPPSQEPDFLAKSAMGKIPALETDAGFIAETPAILDYLEEAYPDKPLLPSDPYARAKVRELVLTMELYVELVARRGFGVLRGNEVSDDIKQAIGNELPRGAAAVASLAKFSPWIAGDSLTYADLVGYFSFIYATRSAEANAGIDLFESIPGSRDWYAMVGERDSIKKALADQQR